MISIPSFAKINFGLKIGPARADGFHELRTIYQTVALRDVVRVEVAPGSGIEIRCNDPRVPLDETNTCYRIAEHVTKAAGVSRKVTIEIEKHLPVQGGMPIMADGTCIGSVGVSGVQSHEDEQIAQAGIDALLK